jgi:hypothetical protein
MTAEMTSYILFATFAAAYALWFAFGLRRGAKPRYMTHSKSGSDSRRMSRASLWCSTFTGFGCCVGIIGLAMQIRWLTISGWSVCAAAFILGAAFHQFDEPR